MVGAPKLEAVKKESMKTLVLSILSRETDEEFSEIFLRASGAMSPEELKLILLELELERRIVETKTNSYRLR